MVITHIKRSVLIIAIAITSLNQLLLYCCRIFTLNRDAVGLNDYYIDSVVFRRLCKLFFLFLFIAEPLVHLHLDNDLAY